MGISEVFFLLWVAKGLPIPTKLPIISPYLGLCYIKRKEVQGHHCSNTSKPKDKL
jgi:hypothetical protein